MAQQTQESTPVTTDDKLADIISLLSLDAVSNSDQNTEHIPGKVFNLAAFLKTTPITELKPPTETDINEISTDELKKTTMVTSMTGPADDVLSVVSETTASKTVSESTAEVVSDLEQEDSSATSHSELPAHTIDDIRKRAGYIPYFRLRPTDNKGGNTYLAGHFHDKVIHDKVIHVISAVERFLAKIEVYTPMGHRYLVQKPGRLVLEDDDVDDEDGGAEIAEVDEHTTVEDVEDADAGQIQETNADDSAASRLLTEEPLSKADDDRRRRYNYEEYFEIRESKLGGLGAFAVKDLKKGDLILVEKPVLKTTNFNLIRDFYNLDDDAKKVYLSLQPRTTDGSVNTIESIKRANAFEIPDGVAIFGIAARFNHACTPARNVKYCWDKRRQVITLMICEDLVPAGTELLLTYGGSPASLYRTFGFVCTCGGCMTLTDWDIKMLQAEEMGIVL
ncbi:hypothetical protein B0H66DRAFT_27846 [Apodospora peruviana]|uniref:SET domain-containing protein n=1 Tax=Apodospora peruviana TaxID=516989 RepID=A0AAE0IR01_9PEZI|nr:hypothetical protein B0H66DRAFT_27846 [Apodospora peruviana]